MSEPLRDPRLVREVMERLMLLEPGDPIEIEELGGGVSSTVLKVNAGSETYCLKQSLAQLKVPTVWEAPVERVYAEIGWLHLANGISPGCAPKVIGVDRPTNSFVMLFLSPENYPNWKAKLLSGNVDISFAVSVAATLVRLHRSTADQEAIKNAFANEANFVVLRLEPYLLETARNRPDQSSSLRMLAERTRMEKRALIHGDVSPKNILAGPSGPVFLDAECACYGDPAFDAAFLLNHLLLKSVAIPDSSASLLSAFDECAAAYLSGVDWEPLQNIERRVAMLLPGLTLARISGKSPVEYLSGTISNSVARVAGMLIDSRVEDLKTLKGIWKEQLHL